MEKTLTIKRAEFTQQLAQLITKSGLPPFVVSDTLTIVLNEVKALANEQLQKDLQEYKSAPTDDDKNDD